MSYSATHMVDASGRIVARPAPAPKLPTWTVTYQLTFPDGCEYPVHTYTGAKEPSLWKRDVNTYYQTKQDLCNVRVYSVTTQ